MAGGTGFSLIAPVMEREARELEERRAIAPAEIWPEKERTPIQRDRRVARALQDFWFFDRTYFPASVHSGGYAPPCSMHRDLLTISSTPGVHIVLGPRNHGKTAYAVKIRIWRYLNAQLLLGGTYSQTLPTSERLLATIADVMADNPRIDHDFGVTWIGRNAEELRFHTRTDRRVRLIAAFSEGRSVRGFSYKFGRPSDILADDIETLTSSLGHEQVQGRIDAVGETFSSTETGASLTLLANAFDTRCSTWKLWQEQEKGNLPDHWRVHRYQAWTSRGPLWKSRFPATTEQELRAMLKPRDERDWRGNYQSDPIERDGLIFTRDHYHEWAEIPADAKGVAYCDPNLSLKGRGDTTAMGAQLWSTETQRIYLRDLDCRSFSDSNQLLTTFFELKRGRDDIYCMGMDGNVSQEAQWMNHIRNFARMLDIPLPRVEFCRYHVDLLIKTVQAMWVADLFWFPPGFAETEIGRVFLAQLYAFEGKRAGRRDDAPDWLICCAMLLHDRGLARPKRDDKTLPVVTIPDLTTF